MSEPAPELFNRICPGGVRGQRQEFDWQLGFFERLGRRGARPVGWHRRWGDPGLRDQASENIRMKMNGPVILHQINQGGLGIVFMTERLIEPIQGRDRDPASLLIADPTGERV